MAIEPGPDPLMALELGPASLPASADAIVVGAGAAGCVVAARLAAEGRSVVVVEAGPGPPRPASVLGHDPVAAASTPGWTWSDLEARARPDGPAAPYRQGRGIGGGSAINGLILAPGDRADYRAWASVVGPAWGPDAMAPWLDAAAAAFQPISIPAGPVTGPFLEALAAGGHGPVVGDSLEPDRNGVMAASLALVDGRRVSAADRFLAPAMAGGAVRLIANAPVDHIRTTGGDRSTAAGVALVDGRAIDAPLVVSCAGAIGSPALLRRSGLAGPSVGRRLIDHPSVALTLRLTPEVADRDRLGLASHVLRWSPDRDGADQPAGSDAPGADAGGDLQAFVLDRVDDGGAGAEPLAVVAIGLLAPTSIGRLGADGQPITAALSTETDRVRFRAGVRHLLDRCHDRSMAGVVSAVLADDRGTPASALAELGDTDLDRWLLANPGPYAHPTGTCPLGPVVSSDPADGGRLVDRNGVHVIDASVLPGPLRAGPWLTVTAVADRLGTALARLG
ncbi:MAG: GMC family oxidoreductase [Actinomycetota bacterium]